MFQCCYAVRPLLWNDLCCKGVHSFKFDKEKLSLTRDEYSLVVQTGSGNISQKFALLGSAKQTLLRSFLKKFACNISTENHFYFLITQTVDLPTLCHSRKNAIGTFPINRVI